MGLGTNEELDPPALVSVVLQAVRLWTEARSVALFDCRGHEMRLVLSQSIDQGVLDDMHALWPDLPLELRQGAVYRGRRDFLVVPCTQHDVLRGLLYLEGAQPPDLPASRALGVLAVMLVGALGAPAPSSEPEEGLAPVGHVPLGPEGNNLLYLLERNEWNVTRVARLLGVTRTTIYNRLRRLGVPRQRVRLTPPVRRRPVEMSRQAS